jgi:hypothetical protein
VVIERGMIRGNRKRRSGGEKEGVKRRSKVGNE